MYCPSCGIALAQQMKFCNRCGSQTAIVDTTLGGKTPAEKRLDEYLDGLFWITVIGLGAILGGLVALKKTGFSAKIILAYFLLSGAALFSIAGTLSLMRSSKDGKLTMRPGRETPELEAARPESLLRPATSVTEHTTRSFEPVLRKPTQTND